MTEINRTQTRWPAAAWPAVLLVLLLASTAAPQAVAQEDDEDSSARIAEERLELLNTIAAAHYDKAGLLSEQGEPEAAIRELRKILTLPFPEGEAVARQLFLVNVTILEIYLEAGRFAEAEKLGRETLQEITDRKPQTLAELHVLLAHALRGQGKDREALEQLDRAIELGRAALEELD